MGGFNLFWLFYLSWEIRHYKRTSDDELKWYEKELFE
jgi:hypothetical protein